MDEQTKSAVGAAIRTIIQPIPYVGSAFAQAWSEAEGIRRDRRIQEYFDDLAIQLSDVKSDSETLKLRIEKMEDFAQLLEASIDAVRRESNETKRKLFPRALMRMTQDSSNTTHDERLYILELLDSLTLSDLEILAKFLPYGHSRGDVLTQTGMGSWRGVGDAAKTDAEYDAKLGATMISTSKLEARGVIVPDADRGGFMYSGTGGEWHNNYRQKAWRLMPIGRKLLSMTQ